MNTNRSSTAAQPTTYNGQQFDAPGRMTRLWATVTLLIAAGLTALGLGIAGAVLISPVALGAGAIVGLPFLVFGGIMGHYTHKTAAQVYPASPKPQVVTPRAVEPPGEAGHVVMIHGKPGPVLPDVDIVPELAKPAPNLRHFPICANDVLYVLERSWREGTGFRKWERHKLPSGVRVDRGLWIGVQDGMLRWQFATARQTQTGRVVELRQDVSVDEMMAAVRKGAQP